MRRRGLLTALVAAIIAAIGRLLSQVSFDVMILGYTAIGVMAGVAGSLLKSQG